MFEVGMMVQNNELRAELFGADLGKVIKIGMIDDREVVETEHEGWFHRTMTRWVGDVVAVQIMECDCGKPIYVIDYLCEACRG